MLLTLLPSVTPSTYPASGEYYVDCAVETRPSHRNPLTDDAELAARLWSVSEKLTALGGEKRR